MPSTFSLRPNVTRCATAAKALPLLIHNFCSSEGFRSLAQWTRHGRHDCYGLLVREPKGKQGMTGQGLPEGFLRGPLILLAMYRCYWRFEMGQGGRQLGDSGPGTHVCLRRDTTFEHLTRCLLSPNLTYLPHKSKQKQTTKSLNLAYSLTSHIRVVPFALAFAFACA